MSKTSSLAPLTAGIGWPVPVRLAVMMFAQYVVIGSWWVTLGSYMSRTLGFDNIIGVAYGMQGIAVIAATLVVGTIADRFIAAQKLMGVLMAASGLVLLWVASIRHSESAFLVGVLAHLVLFMPTVPLANTIALNAMNDTATQFPLIRAFGTVGWIVAGLTVGSIPGASESRLPMEIGGCTAVLLGLYAFSLPDTPARAHARPQGLLQLFGLDTVVRMADGPFRAFIGASLLIVIPLAFYYAYCNAYLADIHAHIRLSRWDFEPAAIQTLGQVSEVLVMLLLPLLLARLGIKRVLLIGMLAWALRYVLFAFGFDALGPVMPILLLGILLHGICNDCFFVAGQIYIDARAPEKDRARAQAFLSLVTSGVGIVAGSNLAGWVYGLSTVSASVHEWRGFWLVPGALAIAVAIVFAGTFRDAWPLRESQ